MEDLVNLTNILTQIKKLCRDIIERTLNVMEDLKTADNDYVDDVIDRHPEVTPQKALALLRGAAESITYIPHLVVTQIDSFTKHLLQGDSILSENIGEYEYLAEVWYGDIYDTEGIEGLKLLLSDLKSKDNLDITEKVLTITEKNIRG